MWKRIAGGLLFFAVAFVLVFGAAPSIAREQATLVFLYKIFIALVCGAIGLAGLIVALGMDKRKHKKN